MSNRGFIEELRHNFSAGIQEAAVVNGTKADSWEDYQRRRGRIQGLQDGQRILEDALRKFFKDEVA